jgi:hypothetical protein
MFVGMFWFFRRTNTACVTWHRNRMDGFGLPRALQNLSIENSAYSLNEKKMILALAKFFII